jgi:hypothetical protein
MKISLLKTEGDVRSGIKSESRGQVGHHTIPVLSSD